MTRDDIKRLAGGYATGSLTDAEKQALFEAALDDQDLFEELAQEQAIKEAIEIPGARVRLIAALEPPVAVSENGWWAKPWPWAIAATFAMGVVVAVAIWPRPKVVELVAQSNTTPPVPSPVSNPEPAREMRNAPEPAERRRDAAKTVVSTEAKPIVKKEADAPQARPVTAPAPPPTRAEEPPAAPKPQAAGTVGPAQQSVIVAPAAPSIQQTSQQTQSQGQPGPVQQAQQVPQIPQGVPADQLKTQFRQGVVGGAGGGSGGRAFAPSKAARFGFRYRFDQQGRLEITPLAQGYLTVTATQTIYPVNTDGHVPAGTPIYVSLPAQATEIDVVFSAVGPAVDALADAAAGNKTEKRKAAASSKDAVVRQAGTVEDTAPTPQSRVSITLPVPKRN